MVLAAEEEVLEEDLQEVLDEALEEDSEEEDSAGVVGEEGGVMDGHGVMVMAGLGIRIHIVTIILTVATDIVAGGINLLMVDTYVDLTSTILSIVFFVMSVHKRCVVK